MFTDTHCHLYKEYYNDLDRVIKRAQEAGIKKMIVNGSNLESNEEALTLSLNQDSIYAAIGFHPEDIESFDHTQLSIIVDNVDKIVAIGEIGLDYHYTPCDREAQKRLFASQLDLAKKYHLPVIVHSRDATEDTIEILKRYPEVKGSIHCFTGSLETAQIYIKMGYKLGFGGVTTFKNAKIKEILSKIPKESILLETDSPYLAPEPVRGSQNEPANIKYIAEFIAKELGVTTKELSTITEENVHDLFDI